MKRCDEFTLSRAEELFLIGKALLIGGDFVNAEFDFVREVLPDSKFACKNKVKAVKCFREAAELGNKEAKIILGRCYQIGIGTDINYEEAIRLMKEPAEKGCAVAQAMIGGMYLRGGYGIEKNTIEAVKWLKLAVENGSQHAKSILNKYHSEEN